jgi:hypothetical protein
VVPVVVVTLGLRAVIVRFWRPSPCATLCVLSDGHARVAEWQTRWLQVPVLARVWGFKSPLAHMQNPAPSEPGSWLSGLILVRRLS